VNFAKCSGCGWTPHPGDVIPCDNIWIGPFRCPKCNHILEVKGGDAMNTGTEKAKEFKDKILGFLKSSNKTAWGKTELQILIKDLWIEFLEKDM
jgi:hypothetical protein